jgi:hypothetical protein
VTGALSCIVIRFLLHESIASAVTDVQHRHDAVALVNRVNIPVTMPLAPVKQVAEIAVFGSRGASGRVFVEA